MLCFVSMMRFICLHLIKAGDAALSFRDKYLHINNMILFIFPSDFFHLVGDVPEKKHPVERDIKVL